MFFLILVAFFLSSPLPAKPLKDEWIIKKRTRTRSWKEVADRIRDTHQFVRSFGPSKQLGLFRGRSSPRKNKGLPKEFRASDIQPNYRYEVLDALDPEVENTWGLNNTSQPAGTLEPGYRGVDIQAFPAWSLFKGSKKVVVAVLDTGIDLAHEDLKNNVWTNSKEKDDGEDNDEDGFVDDLHGWNFVDQNKNVQDDNRHGTLCSGIIGADAGNGKGSRGVNWEVTLMPVKILAANGTGSTEQAISGIEYAVSHGAKILNLSWGGTNYDPALFDALKWAEEKGVLIVAASGNSAVNNDDGVGCMYPASYPLKNLISVASYDNRDKISNSSNFGKLTTHLGAPGVQVYSTVPGGYAYVNGTSFAAPFVAGVAALLWGYAPTLETATLKDRLLMTSTVIDYYEKERTLTAGRVNAWNALKNERPIRPQTPTEWTRVPYPFQTAHPYNDFEKASFRIHHPGATHIRLHFKRFETEKGYDTVVIRDAAGKWINTYSGNLNTSPSADALGETIQFDFTADYAKSAHGIEIDYYEVSF